MQNSRRNLKSGPPSSSGLSKSRWAQNDAESGSGDPTPSSSSGPVAPTVAAKTGRRKRGRGGRNPSPSAEGGPDGQDEAEPGQAEDEGTIYYLEDEPAQGATQGAAQQAEQQTTQEATPESIKRRIGNAVVTFQDGAAVANVDLPLDYSAIRLDNLPSNLTPASVASILRESSGGRFLVQEKDVQVLGADRSSAVVTMKSRSFAKDFCAWLSQRPSETVRAISIDYIMIPVRYSGMDCNKVHGSWDTMVRTAMLEFNSVPAGRDSGHSAQVARAISDRFRSGIYEVRGCKVTALEPVRAPPSRQVLSLLHMQPEQDSYSYVVALTGLAAAVTVEELRAAVGEGRPYLVGITMSEPEVESIYAKERVTWFSAMVQSMFEQCAPLQSWRVFPPERDGEPFRFQAQFRTEANAKVAVMLFNKKRLDFSSHARLAVQFSVSPTTKVLSWVYNAVLGRINEQREAWTRHGVELSDYYEDFSKRGQRVLKLEGDDSWQVGKAFVQLCDILDGVVVKRPDGKPLWSDAFLHHGEAFQEFLEVVGAYDVQHAFADGSEIVLYGSEDQCRAASEAINDAFAEGRGSELLKSSVSIPLSEDEYQWALAGGHRTLLDIVGEEGEVHFEIGSTPKRFVIRGSPELFEVITETISALPDSLFAAPANAVAAIEAPPTVSADYCAVCLNEAENPVRTSCNHVYCGHCFADMCKAETTWSRNSGIACVHESSCHRLVPLRKLREVLSSAEFEDVLKASFASHVRRSPSVLRYCNGPDCGFLYRPVAKGEAAETFKCTNCWTETCMACHATHPGMACHEFKYDREGGNAQFARCKRENDIRECPVCDTPIISVGACNHIECPCGAHICWWWGCMTSFTKSSLCINHMRREGHERGFGPGRPVFLNG